MPHSGMQAFLYHGHILFIQPTSYLFLQYVASILDTFLLLI